MGQGGNLPHRDALRDGANRAESTPEGLDRAGRRLEEAIAELIQAMQVEREPELIALIVERVAEVRSERDAEKRSCVHHDYHTHVHEHPVERVYMGARPSRFNRLWVIIGAIIGFLLALLYLLSVNGSLLDIAGIKPGTHVAVMNSVDQWWYWVVALVVGTALGAGVGLVTSLIVHRDEE
jgi:hypothetical protein